MDDIGRARRLAAPGFHLFFHPAMNADSDLVLPSGFRRVDMVRLITQCLTTLGYENAAQALQQESGMLLASEPIAHFRTAVLNGSLNRADLHGLRSGGIPGVHCAPGRFPCRAVRTQ